MVYLLETNWADITSNETATFQVFFGCHIHIDGTIEILQLHFIHFVVPANHSQYHRIIQLVHHSLHRLFHRRMKIITNHLNGMLSRSSHQFLFLVIVNITFQSIWFYCFDIGSEITVLTIYNIGFARISQYFKFMGRIAADSTGVSNNRAEIQTATGENAIVRIIHELVLLIQAFLVHIKGVSILHDKLTAAHEAETRTLFISVLVLNLVHRHRKLLVRRCIHRNQSSHQFFMGRSQAIISAMTILKLKHFFPVHIPTAALLPNFSRLHDRHQNFLRAGLIDFLADNIFYLLDRTESQRQVRISAVGNLTHHACFQHVFMGHNHRIGRQFSKSWAV